jgi:hypothetical protein
MDRARSFLVADKETDLAAAGARGFRFTGGALDVFLARRVP